MRIFNSEDLDETLSNFEFNNFSSFSFNIL